MRARATAPPAAAQDDGAPTKLAGGLAAHAHAHTHQAHAHAVARARAPAGPGYANIVLNNTNVCCKSCCGPKRETLAKDLFGNHMDINVSLPKMPKVLEGKLDEATWKQVLRAMGKTGAIAPDVVLNICSRLTCTVRPARIAAVLAAALTRWPPRPRSAAASCRAPWRALRPTTRSKSRSS